MRELKNNQGLLAKVAIVLILTMLSTLPISAQPVSDNNGETQYVVGMVSTTMSFDVPAGDDRLLVVQIGQDSPYKTVSSITYNGTPMINEINYLNAVGIWYLSLGSSETTTSGTIAVTLASQNTFGIGAISFHNTDQGTPVNGGQFSAVQLSTSNSTTSTLTISGGTNDLALDGVSLMSFPTTYTMGTGQTQTYELDDLVFVLTGSTKTYSGSTTNMSWTFPAVTSGIYENGYHFGININAVVPLPVTLTSFSGKTNGTEVFLSWTTSSEYNNKGFEVQRSRNTVDWIPVGYVDSKGHGNETHYYTFTDKNFSSEVIYYRLKQEDFDGSIFYSTTISLEIKFADDQVLLYPNPVKEVLNILVKETNISNNPEIMIFTQSGQLVIKENHPISSIIQINAKNLVSGVYIIQINTGNKKLHYRFVKS